MPINVRVLNNILAVKVSPCNNFYELRNKLLSLPDKEAEYDSKDNFKYWKMPVDKLHLILSKFPPEELDISPDLSNKIEEYKNRFTKLELLISDITPFSAKDGKNLFDHQLKYVQISPSKKSLLCSFEMGMGKSRATLVRAKTYEYSKLLIIVPSIVLSNWATEIKTVYGEDCLVYSGEISPVKRFNLRKEISNHNIFVVNYEMVGELLSHLPAIDHIIIDEIHNLSNPSTVIYKNTYKALRKFNCPVQGASGTPMRLRVRDLWGVLHLIDPDFAGARADFLSNFEVELAHKVIIKNGKRIKIPIKLGTKNEDLLKEKLDCILYRVKRSVLTTFKENVEIVPCILTSKQKEMYSLIQENILRDLESGELYGTQNVLVRMLRLLQVSEGCFNIDPTIPDSGKYDYLKQEIDSTPDKLIIWSRFKPITEKILKDYPDRAVVYTGDTASGLKKLSVWAFQGVTTQEDLEEFNRLKKYHPGFKFAPGEASIFTGTVNLRSGLGINLHKANKCIFTSFDFNPQANMQAKDRVSRIGQESDSVSCKFLVSEDTLEAKALSMILTNYENSLRILDGKKDNSYLLIKDLIKLLKE